MIAGRRAEVHNLMLSYPESSINVNMALTVFFEENGSVFAEFEAGIKLVRAWIDKNNVSPK
jgi:hypothetical protein